MAGVGLIILAAGCSSRLGQPKQLLEFDGRTLIRRAAETALASICRPVIVVLGAHAIEVKQELHNLQVNMVTNREWELGIGASIKMGLQTLAAIEIDGGQKTEGALFMLSDQPLVTPGLLNELALTFKIHGGIVASSYNQMLGVPTVLARRFDQELMSLPPRAGAKQVIERHPDEVEAIEFSGGATDIDTPEDYQKLSHSTVTLLARLRGLSTSHPRETATE